VRERSHGRRREERGERGEESQRESFSAASQPAAAARANDAPAREARRANGAANGAAARTEEAVAMRSPYVEAHRPETTVREKRARAGARARAERIMRREARGEARESSRLASEIIGSWGSVDGISGTDKRRRWFTGFSSIDKRINL
jgi:hypothetical protein